MNRQRLLTLMMVLAVFAALPAAVAAQEQVAEEFARSDIVTVKVLNHNWMDMRVYALVGGHAYRLGTVPSFTSKILRVPRTVVTVPGDLQLVVVPIGRRVAHYARSIAVFPGDRLEYRIENALQQSVVYRI